MSRKFVLLSGLPALVIANPAFAQKASALDNGVSQPDNGGLAEIVVTAQKREQNLQTVPVSVTALGSEAIENGRIADFSDLTRAASSLTVTQQTSSPNNAIILRGIGTFAFSIGVEPSVAVIVDDLPVVQQAQAFDSLDDVERIEVLKGPQGTLFGKNASAGVVNIVTKDPTRDLTGSVSVTAATDSDVRTTASISGPIGSGGSGFRLSGYYHSYNGNVNNLTSGTRINDQENYGFRGKLKLAVTDRLTYTIEGAYSHARQSGTTTTIRSIDPAGTPASFGIPALKLVPSLTGITPGVGNYNSRVDALGATTNTTATVEGRGVLDLGGVDLISVTGFQDWKYNFQNDVDGTDLNLIGYLTKGAVNGGLAQTGPYHSTDFTQELRLVSTGHGALKYVAGLFYANGKTDRSFTRGPIIAKSDWFGKATTESYAAFAQLDYTLPTETTISGGIRANHEKIGASFVNTLSNATANTCAAGNPLCSGTHSDDVVTWKASLSQQVAPKVMIYTSVAKGYKGYAYDISSGFNPARVDATLNGTGPGLVGVGPIKAEHSTSYEIGIKSRTADNRLQLNVTAFLTDYNNFQAQSAVFVGGVPQLVLNNVGKLKTKGIEVETSAKPNEWLRFDGSAAYTDAVMTSFPDAQAYSGQLATDPACTTAAANGLCTLQDRSGAALPNSPKFKFNLGATAEFPFGDGNKATFTLAYQHQSSVNYGLLGNPLTVQKGYGVLNTSLGFDLGAFRASVFVNNVFDKHYAAYLDDGFSLLGGSATNPAHVIYQLNPRDSQRYAGIKLQYNFGN
ncbi:MAG: TonB-dependent receptor [Sphingomonadales bacterium]|nr:TonB-dependent receptor [Sphingomonadales bacterium]MDE2569889.1 TonB-dependent receptor [Sphingomonadales bacterium]